ncbi:hypothetical protein J7K97_06575 [Candidatus Aerophobetes bacterium]|nr:hypothetical protein [Candidatus Aerophobetes bacterium]
MKDKDNVVYTVITGDLVSSKKVENRAFLQQKVELIMDEINEEFKSSLVVPFNFTAGDEFQGLVSELEVSFNLTQWWKRRLFPWRTRFGIGVGRLSTPIARATSSMDGECFHRAREAIEMAEKEKRYLIYRTGDFILDMSVNTVIFLMETIQRDWKEIHYKRYWLYKELGTLEKVATREDVSKQAVIKTLKAAKYSAIMKAEESIKILLSAFQNRLSLSTQRG